MLNVGCKQFHESNKTTTWLTDASWVAFVS